jgi:hypothetical protein
MKMKLHAKLAAAALLAAIMAAAGGCATADGAVQGEPAPAGWTAADSADFSGALGSYWILAEIRTALGTVTLDREGISEMMDFDDIFTLRFDDGRVNGRAAPNLYNGPFELGAGYDISLGMMASTMMFAFMEPEELAEHEFFMYLHNAFMWRLAGGNLELHTVAENGGEAVLVFVLF